MLEEQEVCGSCEDKSRESAGLGAKILLNFGSDIELEDESRKKQMRKRSEDADSW
jgi:hypothetical protein